MKKILLLFLCALSIFITINIGGVSYAKAVSVGEELDSPENGWNRYDCRNSMIKYEGSGWHLGQIWYNVYHSSYGSSNAKIKFTFSGSRLRIIDGYWSNNSKDSDVIIDGKFAGKYVTCKGSNCSGQNLLVYENDTLSEGSHNVEIVSNTTEFLTIHSIDIWGSLIPYSKVSGKEILNISPSSFEVKLNENVEADVSISKIDDITLEDMTITYDSSKLKYLGTKAMDGVRILKNKSSEGSLRVVCKGAKSKAAIKTALLKLKFQTKAAGDAYIKVSEADVSNGKSKIKQLTDNECAESIINIK